MDGFGDLKAISLSGTISKAPPVRVVDRGSGTSDGARDRVRELDMEVSKR
jgi:hypothetical protein